MDEMDREELLRLFGRRDDANARRDKAMQRYYEGRIDGHCLQNAIDEHELRELAAKNGFNVTWQTAMAVVEA